MELFVHCIFTIFGIVTGASDNKVVDGESSPSLSLQNKASRRHSHAKTDPRIMPTS